MIIMTTREKVEGRLLYMSLHRPDVYPFFRFAYLTGIRVEDAYVDNWIEFIPPDALIIQPSKHNNVRVIRDAREDGQALFGGQQWDERG